MIYIHIQVTTFILIIYQFSLSPLLYTISFRGQKLTRIHQGCAGRPFIPRGGAGRGKGKNPRGGAGRGEGENPRGGAGRGGAGRGEKARKSTNSKILQKCEKYNITYYNINYKVKVKESFIFLLYFQKHVLLSLWRLHNVHIIITIHL